MITIDGSYGEGGGQILRTSIALSLVTGKSFQINKIRAGRKRPGLMRQHLTAVNAAVEIGNASITGNSIGSQSFTFEPETIKAGNYRYSIGTAGSCTLVLQAILPALIMAENPSEIVMEGGTHNPFAPPFDFLEKAFIPVINRMGANVSLSLEKAGFYPAGGGKFTVNISPAKKLSRIDITDRGKIISQQACAAVSNLPTSIADRELKVVGRELEWDKDCLMVKEVNDSPGPGNILTLEIKSENITEVFTGFGEYSVKAEKVAKRVVSQVKEYLDLDVPVGRYLADQLLIPLALAGGGKFRTLSPTKHTVTNIEIIKQFLDVEIKLSEYEKNKWEIEIWNG